MGEMSGQPEQAWNPLEKLGEITKIMTSFHQIVAVGGKPCQHFLDEILNSNDFPWLNGELKQKEILQEFLMEPKDRSCLECDGPGCCARDPAMRCSSCKCFYYCGKECQKKHWKSHKQYCLAIKDKIIAHANAANNRQPYSPHDQQPRQPPSEVKAINTECPICLEDPVVNPIILEGCHHAFCFACLDRYQSTHRSADASSNLQQMLRGGVQGQGPLPQKQCPMCRAESEDVRETILNTVHWYGAQSCAPNIGRGQAQELRAKALAEADRLLAIGEDMEDKMTRIYVKTVLAALSMKLQMLTLAVEECPPGERPQNTLDALREAADSMSRYLGQAFSFAQQNPGRDLFPKDESVPFYLEVAKAFGAHGSFQAACVTFENLFKLVVGVRGASYYNLRRIGVEAPKAYFMAGNYDRAIDVAKKIAEERDLTDGAGFHKYLVLSLLKKDKREEARKYLERAIFCEASWDEEHHKDLLIWYNFQFLFKFRLLCSGSGV